MYKNPHLGTLIKGSFWGSDNHSFQNNANSARYLPFRISAGSYREKGYA